MEKLKHSAVISDGRSDDGIKKTEQGPLLSVIMPCYNTEKYIGKTLASLYGQTVQDFEIIFVNDGSTDGTLEILEACRDKLGDRVKIITVENGGQSRARNIGMDEASGEFIVFLDSDDYIDVDYFEVLLEAAVKNDSDMVLSGQHKVNEHGSTIANIDYPVDKISDFVLRRLNPHGKLYRRSFLNEHNIRYAKGKLYEDNAFNLVAMFICKNQVILPYNGHYQVIHGGSTMTKPMDPDKVPYEALEEAIAYTLSHKELITDENIFEFTVLSFMTYFIFQANRRHIYDTGKQKGRRSSKSLLKEICRYTKRIIPEYFPKYYKNPYVGIFKCRYLSLSQRLGVWLFCLLLRFNLLWPFVWLFYSI